MHHRGSSSYIDNQSMQSIESIKGDPILTIDNNLQSDKIKII